MDYVINKYPEAIKKFEKLDVNKVRWGQRVRNKNAMDLISVQEVIKKIDEIRNNLFKKTTVGGCIIERVNNSTLIYLENIK